MQLEAEATHRKYLQSLLRDIRIIDNKFESSQTSTTEGLSDISKYVTRHTAAFIKKIMA